MEALQTNIRTNNGLIILVAELESVVSDKYNFIIEDVYKIITDEGSRNAGFNIMMALNQPGYRAENDSGLIIVFF